MRYKVVYERRKFIFIIDFVLKFLIVYYMYIIRLYNEVFDDFLIIFKRFFKCCLKVILFNVFDYFLMIFKDCLYYYKIFEEDLKKF